MRPIAVAALAFCGLAPAAAAAPVWQEPVQVSSTTGELVEPAIAAAGDQLAVAWVEDYQTHLSARRVDGFEVPVVLSSAGSFTAAPALGLSGAGEAIVAWRYAFSGRDEGGIEAAIRDADGGFETTRITSAVTSDTFRLAVNSSGEAALAWIEGGVSEDEPRPMLHVAFRRPGEQFRKPEVVVRMRSHEFGIALSELGQALIVWADTLDDGTKTTQARVGTAQGGFGETQLLQRMEPTLNQPQHGTIRAAWTPNGDPVAAWSIQPAACLYCLASDVYVSIAPSGGRFGDPQLLSRPAANRGVDLAVRPDGAIVVAWDRSAVSRFDPPEVPDDVQVSTGRVGQPFSPPASHGVSEVAFDPRLASAGSNSFLSWLESGPDPNGLDTLVGAFRPDAEPLVRPIAPRGQIFEHSLAGGADGRLYEAWVQQEPGPVWRLLVAAATDDSKPPRIRRFRVKGSSRLTFSFVLSEVSEIELRLRRRGTNAPQLTRNARRPQGRGRLTLSARALRRLRPGHYRAALCATDAAGQTTRSRVLRVRLVRP